MAIRVALHHHTSYSYDRLVTLGPQTIRLRPAPHCPSPIVSYSQKVEPADHFVNWQQDPSSNYLARYIFNSATRVFNITVDLVVDLTPLNPFDFFMDEEAETYPFSYEPKLRQSLQPFLRKGRPTPLFQSFLDTVDLSPRRTIDFLVHVNGLVHQKLHYSLRMEPGVKSPERSLKEEEGSCRDFAWLLVQTLRRCGLAARFVSGYSIQLRPDEKPVDPNAPGGVESDICDLHAWCEVFLPGAGWVGLDATSGLFCGEGHIPLATSASTEQAAPIEGNLTHANCDFDVTMSITRLHEDPRVTAPVTDGQWTSILALGDRIDEQLHAQDVRLSMGGEPTFVSIADANEPEWNTEAVGGQKKALGNALLQRLRGRFGPGSLVHTGQGKWYPGEPLPRWSLAIYWRKDGVAMWDDDRLIGDETTEGQADHLDAEKLTLAIADQLMVQREHVRPAYEDPIYYVMRERNIPANLDLDDPRIDDPEARSRIRTVLERGLGTPVGYLLPVERVWRGNTSEWHSGMWMLRSRLYLMPGDSPMGLRLPLKRLPWIDESELPYQHPQDPMQIDAPLAPRSVLLKRQSRDEPLPKTKSAKRKKRPKLKPSEQEDGASGIDGSSGGTAGETKDGGAARNTIRTAICTEARNGHLYVFFPPTTSTEEYLELLMAVEAAASELDTPVLIEGYPPPDDPRVSVLKVTPDPGVLEINIHPAFNWRELVDITETLYEEARSLYLGTEKYQLDGRHTGTGGGNHMVLGGATPPDSPFLRRPDLLRSFIGFWTNHPSMSYLFSGLFIGPTSQAPRADEGRMNATYEMDIAFRQIPEPHHGTTPPWLVDRIFRHLLTDLTGNTHRSEICIDKLFSPDGTAGRLGLVEFRGFEMPPHARMSLVQQLLLRALTNHFWREPFHEPLQHWGHDLHDRFLLPHFIRRDFLQVLDYLEEQGSTFEMAWFASQFEFRFPVVGTFKVDEIRVEVRQAIEPWLVLGEEAGASGTARYVDSSLERVQVLVEGFDLDRFALAVHDVEIPLHPTGRPGQYVAGIRYRAWQPPNCLHPTIAVHAPLVINLIDKSAGRALGGCSVAVSHPGGRAHEKIPVNALEAETRRAERFTPFGHSPGPFSMRRVPANGVTLDLRLT